VDEAMRAGAMGIATALIYPPDSFQTTEDLIALGKVAAAHGGIYANHMRDESADLLDGIGEAIAIGRAANIQVEIFHFKVAYAPGWKVLTPKARALIEDARAAGVNIAANMYVYEAGGTGVDITVPNWVWADGHKAGLEKLKDAAVRARVARTRRRLAARLVEPRPRRGRLGAGRAGERFCAPLRAPAGQELRRHRAGDERGSVRLRLQHPDRGRAEAAGRALLHDVRAGHRDRTRVPVDVDRHRRGGERRRGQGHRDRSAAPTRLRQPSARDRRVREAARGADARGRRAQDDRVAGQPHAPARPWRDPRGPARRRHRLQLRPPRRRRDL